MLPGNRGRITKGRSGVLMRIPCSQALRRVGWTVLGALLLPIIAPGLPVTREARAQVPGSPIGIRWQNPHPAAGDRWPLMFTWNRNKVNWWRFDWREVELPSSTLYYYEQAEPVARLTAALVTDSDRRLQSRFRYDLQRYTADKTIPKIIYTSHHTFEQTNTIAQNIPEGVHRVHQGTGGLPLYRQQRRLPACARA
jgi:hypothetical protein